MLVTMCLFCGSLSFPIDSRRRQRRLLPIVSPLHTGVVEVHAVLLTGRPGTLPHRHANSGNRRRIPTDSSQRAGAAVPRWCHYGHHESIPRAYTRRPLRFRGSNGSDKVLVLRAPVSLLRLALVVLIRLLGHPGKCGRLCAQGLQSGFGRVELLARLLRLADRLVLRQPVDQGSPRQVGRAAGHEGWRHGAHGAGASTVTGTLLEQSQSTDCHANHLTVPRQTSSRRWSMAPCSAARRPPHPPG